MAEMQIYVDGVALDNGTTRRIYGQFRISEVIGAGIVVQVAVFMQANTVDLFQELWNSTKDSFQKKDARVVVTLDTAADTPLEDIHPLDGKHHDVLCNIAFAETKEHTATSGWFEFTCSATTSDIDPGGQLGDIVCTRIYDSARILSITANGVFSSTFNETFAAGLTINSVSDSGGKAVFNVASGAPTYKVGQKIRAIGTTNYQAPNEWHEVTGITAQAIATDTDFVADNTGTLDVGQPMTGLDNYLTAYATILGSCMLTDSDGSRSSSSGMALTGETRTVNDDDETLAFTLSSDWMEVDITGGSGSARIFSMEISTTQPDDWEDVGGQRPIMVSVSGSVTFDKDALGRAVQDSDWNLIETQVQQAVKNKTGQSDLKRISLGVVTSGQSNTIAFTANYIGINLEHFHYEQVSSESSQSIFTKHRDADGFHVVQRSPGDNEVVHTIAVNRSGPGLVNIEPAAPLMTMAGQPALFVNVTTGLGQQGTFTYDEIADVYTQQGTWTYMKFNLRPGATTLNLKLGVV